MSFRILHFQNNDTDKEQIYITEEQDIPSEDFVPMGYSLVSDTYYDEPLSSCFPLDYYFERI